MKTRLSEKEKELVAVGASVAAGCIPCTRYHVKAVQGAGATIDEIVRAVEVALSVKRGTTGIMGRVAHSALGLPTGTEPTGAADVTDRVTRLVAIGASAAVNCPTSFQQYVAVGTGAGVEADEVRLVVALAQMIRAKAATKMDEAADAISVGFSASEVSCGCGAPQC